MDTNLLKIESEINTISRELETQIEIKKLEVSRKEKLEIQLQNRKEAQEIIQSVSKSVQEKAHKQISAIVSKCLSIIFEKPYEFHIIFEQKRGKTEASLIFKRNGLELDPMTSSGGGVIDIAAFALRLACLVLSKPKLQRLLLLDEPFKYVSENYRWKISSMLEQLSTELDIQFILITHLKELEIGKVIKL